MCGIVGYIGTENNAKEVVIEGLKRLEYRGYDSAGIALYRDGFIETRKHVGEISNLEKIIQDDDFESTLGIGHTRWATHGAPSDVNSHPHSNSDNTVTVVHNGIIENYVELRAWLTSEYGIHFKSETDTEVIAQLYDSLFDGDALNTLIKTAHKLEGSYAVAMLVKGYDDTIFAMKKDSPLIVGKGKDENYLASDIVFLK
jgi:glucosamine--fructose-6-phosphate aminotransferase (isomerizing)